MFLSWASEVVCGTVSSGQVIWKEWEDKCFVQRLGRRRLLRPVVLVSIQNLMPCCFLWSCVPLWLFSFLAFCRVARFWIWLLLPCCWGPVGGTWRVWEILCLPVVLVCLVSEQPLFNQREIAEKVPQCYDAAHSGSLWKWPVQFGNLAEATRR